MTIEHTQTQIENPRGLLWCRKMEWSEGDLVWFDPGLGHPLPGEIEEVHRAAQVIVVQALINGKVNIYDAECV